MQINLNSKSLLTGLLCIGLMGCQSHIMEKEFFKKYNNDEQMEALRHYALEDQYRIYRYDMDVMHPMAGDLALPFSLWGEKAIPFMLRQIDNTYDAQTLFDNMFIFAIMSWNEQYEITENKPLVAAIDRAFKRVKNSALKKQAQEISDQLKKGDCEREPKGPAGCKDYKKEKEFVRLYLNDAKKIKILETYPIEDQYRIYRYGMDHVHQSLEEFAEPIVKRGANAMPFMLEQMKIAVDDTAINDNLFIFEGMERKKTYNVRDDKDAMAIIEAAWNRMKYPNLALARISYIQQSDCERNYSCGIPKDAK